MKTSLGNNYKRIVALMLVLIVTATSGDYAGVLRTVFASEEGQDAEGADDIVSEEVSQISEETPQETPQETPTEEASEEMPEEAETDAEEDAGQEEPSGIAPVNGVVVQADADEMEGSNISVSGSVKTDGSSDTILSGERFQYEFQYTIPDPGTGNSSYTNSSIVIKIPNYAEIVTRDDGSYDVNGQHVVEAEITYDSRARTLTIPLQSPLPSYGAYTVTIQMKTNNLETPDGTQLNFRGSTISGGSAVEQIYMQTTYLQGDDAVTIKKAAGDSAITVSASTEWDINKSIISTEDVDVNGTVCRDVTYQLEISDPEGINRNGRLGFETYSIEDILPQTLKDGSPLPQGGEAVSITNVAIVQDGEVKSLTDPNDYYVTSPQGYPASIKFYNLDQVTGDQADQFTVAGQEKNTVYRYTVRYPLKPYTTPSNEDYGIAYELENKAELIYTLTGEREENKEDTAVLTILEWENKPIQAAVKVKKQVVIGGQTIDLTEAAAAVYGEVKFGLFTDEQCTRRAVDTTKTQVPETTVGSDGTLTFNNIRHGTYYLKETSAPEGFQEIGPIKVTVSETDGTIAIAGADVDKGWVVLDDGTATIVVKNQADKLGIVEFEKRGNAADGIASQPLTGATFTLTGTGGTLSGPYTAASDGNGKVRFDSVMEGTYILKETEISAELVKAGYVVSDQTYTITVSGNTVNRPALEPGMNIFMNNSPKGLLEITKTETGKADEFLSGAVFGVYGPYTTQSEAESSKDNQDSEKKATVLTTGNGGKVVSAPLTQGWYILVEEKAPVNYVKNDNPVVVEVIAQTTVSKTIENDPETRVTFTKKGRESASSFVLELAGAAFEIYDSNEAGAVPLKGTKDENGDYRISADGQTIEIETYLDATGRSVSNGIYLQPGTYYYKETKVPSPYQESDQLIPFTVTGSDLAQIVAVDNYLEYGQIKIIKTAADKTGPDNALDGAVFGIYSDDACTVLIEKITTGTHVIDGVTVSGVALSTAQLAIGSIYYVKEISAPAGYALIETIKEARATNTNKVVELAFENEPTVAVEVKKIDSVTSAVLLGAGFTLYAADQTTVVTAQKLTGMNGSCTFEGLSPNTTYYLKETIAPDNYIGEGGFIEVKTGAWDDQTVTIVVKNDRKASVIVEKTTTFNPNSPGAEIPLTGVTFALYKKGSLSANDFDLDTNKVLVGIKTTAGNPARAQWDGLEPGDYWLVETLPEGYRELNGDGSEKINSVKIKSLTVFPGMNVPGYSENIEAISNAPTMGKIKVGKFGAKADGTMNENLPLNGVTFGIYSSEDCKEDELKDTITIGSNGDGISKWLAPGTYYVKETKALNGYVLNTAIYKVEVVAGEIVTKDTLSKELKLINNKKGGFTIEKYGVFKISGSQSEEEFLEQLKGAEFTLYHYQSGETAPAAANAVDSQLLSPQSNPFTMAEYTYTVSNLEPGIYWLAETKTPDDGNWEAINPIIVRVYPDGTADHGMVDEFGEITYSGKPSENIKLELKDYSKKPRIRILKYEYNTTIPVDFARFELYVVDPSGVDTIIQYPGGSGVTIKLSKVDTGDLESGTALGTDGKTPLPGQAITTLLEAGKTYYIKEVGLNHPDYFFDEEYPWSEAIVIPAGDSDEHQVTMYNYKKKDVVGHKTKEDGTSPLSGALVALFGSEADAKAMAEALETEYNEAVSKADAAEGQKYRLTKDMVDDAFKTKYHILMTAESNGRGEIKFEGLVPDKIYYAVELVAPDGYQLDRDDEGNYRVYKLTVNDQGDGWLNGWQLKNWSLKHIIFRKIFKLSGKEYTFQDYDGGPEFTIYGSKAGDDGIVPDLTNPMCVIKATTDGNYASVGLPAGTYFIEETRVPDGFKEPAGSLDANVIRIGDKNYYKVVLGNSEDNKYFTGDNPIVNIAENGKFVLNKVDSTDNSKRVKAVFAVAKYDEDSETFTKYSKYPEFTTATAKDTYSEFLEPGLYRLIEQEAAGYTIDQTPVYIRVEAGKMTDGSNPATENVKIAGETQNLTVYQPLDDTGRQETPILIENVPKGKIEITKEGTWNGTRIEYLVGVKFELYQKYSNDFTGDKNQASQQKNGFPITGTTAAGGKLTFDDLDSGDYWLIETDSGQAAKYGKDSYQAEAIAVKPGATERITVDNPTNYGKFQIQKTSAEEAQGDRTLLSGAAFEILDKDEKSINQRMVNNGDGTYTSPLLAEGVYYLSETTAPEGYSQNTGKIFGPFEVIADKLNTGDLDSEEATEYIAVNPKDWSIQVIKADQDGSPVTTESAYFALYSSKEEAEAASYADRGTPVKEGETGAGGSLNWGQLPAGSYWLKELKAPDNYIIQENILTFTVSEGGKVSGVSPSDGYQADFSLQSPYTLRIRCENILRGSFRLKKQTQWKLDESTTTPVAIAGVQFNIYKDSISEANYAGFVVTDGNGIADSLNGTDKDGNPLRLDAGLYILDEVVPEGYTGPGGEIKINIINSVIDQTYETDPIMNIAEYGRFQLVKKAECSACGDVSLTGATYYVERKSGGNWERLTIDGVDYITINEAAGYLSGLLAPGDYRVIERTAPTDIIHDGKEVQFNLDETPIEFTITAAYTAELEQYDAPKATLTVKKTSDEQNGKVLQADVGFTLWTVKSGTDGNELNTEAELLQARDTRVAEKITAADGTAVWTHLATGWYILEETQPLEGYQAVVQKVFIQGNHTIGTAEQEVLIVNTSVEGRIRIRKVDEKDNPICTAVNTAVFNIYAESDTALSTPLDTVTVGEGSSGLSRLLPVGNYWVLETKAPDGYTLDERIHPRKKLVTVTGAQNPSEALDIIFVNKKQEDVNGFEAKISKTVQLEGEASAFENEQESEQSLMYGEVRANFLISNMTGGSNELPAKAFILTDEKMVFRRYDKDSGQYIDFGAAQNYNEGYEINSVTLYRSYHGQQSDSQTPISAKIEARVGNSWQVVYQSLAGLEKINASGWQIDLPKETMGIRITYEGVEAQFTAGNVMLNVTFKQRGSDPKLPDIRQVVNTASLTWEDWQLDEEGKETGRGATVEDSAAIKFPRYDEEIPYVSLSNTITSGSSQTYYAGNSVPFRTIGTVDRTLDNNANLYEPVFSITLPAYTALDTSKYPDSGVGGIRATLKDGTVIIFSLSEPLEAELDETDAAGNKLTAWKYTLTNFTDLSGNPIVLEPEDSIELAYYANISYRLPDDKILLKSEAHFGSGYQLPLTAENPTGNSFGQSVSHTGGMGADEDIDNNLGAVEGDGIQYVNQPVQISVARSDQLQVQKYIGSSPAAYYSSGEVPVFNPNDTMYYKLELMNAGTAVRTVRFVDILPFDGDTFEFRDKSSNVLDRRSSSLPAGAEYEQPQLLSVNGNPDNLTDEVESLTVYYYMGQDWDEVSRLAKAAVDELPMLWNKTGTVWGENWTTNPTDMSQVTAVGVEVTFTDSGMLQDGDAYAVTLEMRAPGYTAEQMSEYQDAVMANSCAAAVIRDQDSSQEEEISPKDHVSSNQVTSKLRMTTGSIGDYAFYDENGNGIQDEGDRPARNIPVTLYQYKATGSGAVKIEAVAQTVTDNTTGEYLFNDLPCNYRTAQSYEDPEFDHDSENPKYYVGNTFYKYKVEFGIPDGYQPTVQYANGTGNTEYEPLDSNIGSDGMSEWVTLDLTVNEDGTLSGEENLTVDAGYVNLVKLGDYVWLDSNKNGIQDASEEGVNGVKVLLYQLADEQDTITGKQPYREQITGTNMLTGTKGYYCFNDLPKGYYAVLFDITGVKSEGYANQYSFTVANAGSPGADSDAKHIFAEDKQKMYTDVITLFKDDMTIDAGVAVYSALGGFCFDDQDYDNTRSLDIPLPGTIVALYKMNADGSLPETPQASMTAGADGRYLFDYLEEGEYKLHFTYPDGYTAVTPGVGDYLHDSETRHFDDASLNSGFTDAIDLPADTSDLTHDAGAYLVSAIGDYVWYDDNRDGIQDPEEQPVENVPVKLQSKRAAGDWEDAAATTTDAKGYYVFRNLKSSDHYDMVYRVVFGFDRTTKVTKQYQGGDPAKDSDIIEYELGTGYVTDIVHPGYGEEDMTVDAGIITRIELCEIGDYVWYDGNRNGLQDQDEKGLEGVKVVLQYCASGEVLDESEWAAVETTVTDAAGKYIFTDLPHGYYRVGFDLSDGSEITMPSQGESPDSNMYDSDPVTDDEEVCVTRAFYMNPGDSDMTWDAGIYRKSPRTPESIDQTVTKVKTVKTVKPVKTANPRSESSKGAKNVKTRDDAMAGLWLAVAGGMFMLLAYLISRRKGKKNHRNG